ncbi:phosphotransferase [Actinokineospora enzanensis]|uniref:phosphotransferase n=1 Tax=Actinokineospora enzanensis TaxID=155975 RepID=UPI001B7FCA8F|nr:phosphotransferase [Actinokineospora enzanensis]
MTAPHDDHVRRLVVLAAKQLGLDSRGLDLLHRHATAVYLLPVEGVVARVQFGDVAAVGRAVTLTRWLADHAVPVTEPAPGAGPVVVDSAAVSFWVHYPQPSPARVPPAALGRILRDLHGLLAPPVDLPVYRPLASLLDTVTTTEVLDPADRGWLLDTGAALLAAYDALDFPLGRGFVHGDAYPGNLLYDALRGRWLLSDWEEAAIGPRELDLANTYQGVRMGRTAADLDEFAAAYGYDLRDWSGLDTLRGLRDLHSIGAFLLRAAAGDRFAHDEVTHRLDVLRRGDPTTPWHTR